MHSFVLYFNDTIGALNAVDNDDALALVGGVTHRLLLLKDEHAWLVVVQDGHAGARIFSDQRLARALVVQLNVEVLIGLPPIVINNFNFNFCLGLAILESKRFINWLIIFSSSSFAINCSYMNGASALCLIQNFNTKSSSRFTN